MKHFKVKFKRKKFNSKLVKRKRYRIIPNAIKPTPNHLKCNSKMIEDGGGLFPHNDIVKNT